MPFAFVFLAFFSIFTFFKSQNVNSLVADQSLMAHNFELLAQNLKGAAPKKISTQSLKGLPSGMLKIRREHAPRTPHASKPADSTAIKAAREKVTAGLKNWWRIIVYIAKKAGFDDTKPLQKVMRSPQFLDQLSWTTKVIAKPEGAHLTVGTIKGLAKAQGLDPEKTLAFLQSGALHNIIQNLYKNPKSVISKPNPTQSP
jgi:hypothetical protein